MRATRHSKFKPGLAYHNRSAAFSRFLLLHKLNNKDLKLSLIYNYYFIGAIRIRVYLSSFYSYFSRISFVIINLISICSFKVLYGTSYKIKYLVIRFIKFLTKKLFLLEIKKNVQN